MWLQRNSFCELETSLPSSVKICQLTCLMERAMMSYRSDGGAKFILHAGNGERTAERCFDVYMERVIDASGALREKGTEDVHRCVMNPHPFLLARYRSQKKEVVLLLALATISQVSSWHPSNSRRIVMEAAAARRNREKIARGMCVATGLCCSQPAKSGKVLVLLLSNTLSVFS